MKYYIWFTPLGVWYQGENDPDPIKWGDATSFITVLCRPDFEPEPCCIRVQAHTDLVAR